MKNVHCLLCGQDNYTVISEEKLENVEDSYNYLTENACHYRIVKCCKCGMVYSNPIYDEDKILSLYRNSLLDKCVDLTAASVQINMQRYVDRLLSYSGIGEGRFLDIGCGVGYLLKYAKSKGFNVEGVEPNINAAKHGCSILGGDAIKACAYAKELFPSGTFDLITIIHVIDHVVSPKDLLLTAQYHLKPGGYILVARHNIQSLFGRIMGKNFIAYHVQHVGYFTPYLLSEMMNRCGFIPVKILKSLTTYPISHYLENGVRKPWLRENIIKYLKTFKLDRIKLTLPMGNMEIIGKKN